MNDRGHLSATYHPRTMGAPLPEPDLKKLGLDGRRHSYIYVPQSCRFDRPLPQARA